MSKEAEDEFMAELIEAFSKPVAAAGAPCCDLKWITGRCLHIQNDRWGRSDDSCL